MPKVLIAAGCREIDDPATGTRHYARGGARGYERGGLFEMSDGAARRAVAIGGYVVPPGTPAPAGCGFRCPSCGHGSYFTECGKCGTECERE